MLSSAFIDLWMLMEPYCDPEQQRRPEGSRYVWTDFLNGLHKCRNVEGEKNEPYAN